MAETDKRKLIQYSKKSVKHLRDKFEVLKSEGDINQIDYRRQNNVNKFREDMASSVPRSRERQTKTRSASTRSIPSRYSRKHQQRLPHTVPSDRAQSKRIEDAKDRNLSKAIQQHFPDFIKASQQSDGRELLMPDSFKEMDKQLVLAIRQPQHQFRKLLLILKDKTFETMLEWLENCCFETALIKKVLKSYQELCDIETNRKLKCFACRLSVSLPIVELSDSLFSGQIMTDKLYNKIISVVDSVSIDTAKLWEMIITECLRHENQKHVLLSMKKFLIDMLEECDQIEKEMIDGLLIDLVLFHEKPDELFLCHCQKKSSKNIQLDDSLLTKLYLNPHIKPRHNRPSPLAISLPVSSSDEHPVTSSSSAGSDDSPIHDFEHNPISQVGPNPYIDRKERRIKEYKHTIEMPRQRKHYKKRAASCHHASGCSCISQSKLTTTTTDDSSDGDRRERETFQKSIQRNALRVSLRGRNTNVDHRLNHVIYANNVNINTGSKVLYQMQQQRPISVTSLSDN